MVSANANSRILVVVLSVILLGSATFANFKSANAVFDCDGHLATIVGTPGDDVIVGTPGNDVIMGLAGDDIIDGNGGCDIICTGAGSDVVTTGSGNDMIHGEGGYDKINAGDGNNTIDADFGSEGDIITTGNGNDFILLGDGINKINAGDGVNTITTGSGADKITTGIGNDIINAGDGNNQINAGDGANRITTGSGDDKITTGIGNDCVDSGGGTDTINAGTGTNSVNIGSCNIDIPTVEILFPSDGDVFTEGTSISFSGTGNDLEDGNISDSIIWTSDLDGDIGNGATFSFSTLSVGIHSITASVKDSIGNLGSHTHTITIVGISPPTSPVKPILECVEDLGGGNYKAHFGYLNENSQEVTINIGSDNKFTPTPEDRGQPITFNVGRTNYYPDSAFTIDFDGSNLVWTLKGPDGNTRTSTASADPAQRCESLPTLTILSPLDGDTFDEGASVTFSGTGNDIEDGILSSSIIWTSDIDGVIGNGDSFSLSNLSVGTHTIKASVTDSDSHTKSISFTITIGPNLEDLTTLICHFPPGNPSNWQELMIAPSALQAHKEHGDKVGHCVDKDDLEKRVLIEKIKKQREETVKKNELKEKRSELKEIQNELKQLKHNLKNDQDLKDTAKELIDDIKDTLQTLKSDYGYDKEYKEEIKTEFKEIKQKIYDDLTPPEKTSFHTVDSKISILFHSDDPKNDAKKFGLDYKNGKTTVAIQLTDDNYKVLHQLKSLGTIDAKNNNDVQVTINLKDLPKLRSIQGIENIRPPFPAVQFEEPLSEGVYFMNADLAQYAGITGKGIKVAVLDLSFTNNPKISDNIVEVKSFRPGVSVLPDHWNGNEALHGTAVAEIIADVAPDVELYLYSMESDIEFAAAVDEAISKDVDIIAMSAGWPNFPTDGTSPITKKIEEAVEHGIVFVVPAGNFGNKHWEGTFVDSNLNNWHDFSNIDEGLSITVTKERIAEKIPIIADLMWDVGLSDVADFELVLVNPLGEIVDFSANKQEKRSDTPLEYIYHIPDIEGVYSLGVLYSGDVTSPSNRPNANLEIFTVNDKLEYPVAQSSVSVPADANGAIVVGAVNHLDGILEPYSSQGPANNGKLAPDVVGPDGVTTQALDGKPFFGTSATTPYVAGLAALILENNPDLSPEQLLNEIQQNTEPSMYSLQNEYDYGTGYGTASAAFLVEYSEDMK